MNLRILHCSDLHLSEAHFKYLVGECRRYDLLAISGDLIDATSQRPIGDQMDRALEFLGSIPVPVCVCSGNHDNMPGCGARLEQAAWLKEARRKNVWIDGDSFEFGGHIVRCIPWNTPLPGGGADEIWLHHAPPDEAKTGISRGGASFGSFDLGDLCRSGQGPKLALSGHVHDPQSWRARVGHTWSLNPGRPGRVTKPNYIVLDLTRGVATRYQEKADVDFLKI
jgi:Icc-related predicted phosphoesterase